jgi:transcriptional regulator with XRE-family HTH domain
LKRLELAERIIELRERAGLTQGEAAKRAGVGATTWSNLETGTITRPHPRTVIKIARALGAEPEELMARPKVASRKLARDLPGLAAARERRGCSRNELAARSGVTPEEIAELEAGTREADEDILDRLTAALDATRGELEFPPEQYAAFLEADERDNERLRQAVAELSPSELRVLFSSTQLKSPGFQKVRAALNEESPDRRDKKRPASGA